MSILQMSVRRYKIRLKSSYALATYDDSSTRMNNTTLGNPTIVIPHAIPITITANKTIVEETTPHPTPTSTTQIRPSYAAP